MSKIGSGPAGYTAGIYGQANMNPGYIPRNATWRSTYNQRSGKLAG
jgi:hypothetical protein